MQREFAELKKKRGSRFRHVVCRGEKMVVYDSSLVDDKKKKGATSDNLRSEKRNLICNSPLLDVRKKKESSL